MIRYIANSLFLITIFLSSHVIYALPDEGSCVNHRFPGENSDAPDIATPRDTTIMLRILREDTPVYQGQQSATVIKYLKFDTDVKPVQQTSRRIEVIEGSLGTPLGWVEKHDLLCQGGGSGGADFGPLKIKGLPRKVFVEYQADAQDYHAPTYSTPDRSVCASPACEPIVRIGKFKTHFVFAIDREQKRYLIAPTYMLSGVRRFPLAGWIDEERIIPWNTNLGLRPENDVYEQEPDKINVITGYHTLQDSRAQNEKASVKLLEGNIWYTFPLHMPLIDTIEGHYRVAAPGIGMKGFKLSGPSAAVIDALKRVDVFFVIDGTASMEPYIAETKSVVQRIVYQLHQQQAFRETTFRFGFLVYRDLFADQMLDCNDGICETVPLPNMTCAAKPSISETNAYDFEIEIDNVAVTSNDSDDYPEQLFAGITSAIPAIASCGENTKLMFVIADHGDRDNYISQQVIDYLKQNFERIAVYFIQTPEQANKSLSYYAAYNKFSNQASDFIERFYPELNPQERQRYFLKLKDDRLAEKVVNQFVAPYSNSGAINEIEMLLASGGESVKEVINKYRRKEDFPVLYLDWVEDAICDKSPEQCENTIDHQVREFFIPIEEGQMQEELVLIERHIDQWLKLLNPIVRGSMLSGTELREKFIEALIEEIQTILNPETPIEVDDKRTLKEILETSKNALPINVKSPLLQYTFNELQNVPDCELRRLIDWLKSIRAILTKVIANPTLKVSYELVDYQTACPQLTTKGKNIKSMKFKQRQALGKDETYRYGHALGTVTLYWLPMDFLP